MDKDSVKVIAVFAGVVLANIAWVAFVIFMIALAVKWVIG
jgi:hypothetical protein